MCKSWHCGMALLKKSREGAARSLSRLKAPLQEIVFVGRVKHYLMIFHD